MNNFEENLFATDESRLLLITELGRCDTNEPKNYIKTETIVNNLFGENKDKERNLYIDGDDFFIDLYEYYCSGGYTTIMLSNIIDIISLIFGLMFVVFMFILLDWENLLYCDHHCKKLVAYIKPEYPNFFSGTVLFIGCLFTFFKIIMCLHNHRKLSYIYSFYKNKLNITSRELNTMKWAFVLNKIKDWSVFNVYEITNKILRKENYHIALIHNDVIKVSPMLYTKQLELNLNYIIFNSIDTNINEKTIYMKFILFGILNLVFSLFIFIYLLIYFVVSNVYDFYSNSNIISSRRYILWFKWKMRNYNELEHFFNKRLNKSITHATEYIKQFPSPVIDILARFTAIISGCFLSFFLLLSILDENVLIQVTLFSRSLIFYTGIIGAVSSVSHSLIKPPENTVYNPEAIMQKVYKYTQYMPDNWKDRCNTYDVRDQFLSIFQYKIVVLFYDLLSVITTPLILLFCLSKQTRNICSFVKTNTVYKKNIGNICSFSQFDLKECSDKKIQSSIMLFEENNSLLET